MKIAMAKFDDARISFKQSLVLCEELKGKKLDKAKKFLQGLIEQKVSLNRKYYTNAAKKILEILKNAEANARQKGLDVEKTFIKTAKADAGETFVRPKSRFRFRGRKAKSSSILIELEER